MATTCLSGPAFELTGNLSYISQQVAFQLSFDNAGDQSTVLAYDWYLDGDVIINQNLPAFNSTVPCGTHVIGVRLLTSAGWTGVKTVSFYACRPTTSTIIFGPESLDEEATGTYSVIATFADNTTLDVTAEYTLTSSDGTFTGAVFTPGPNTAGVASRTATLSATKTGFTTVTAQITITDSSIDDNTPSILVVDLFSDTTLNVIGLVDNAEVTNNHVAAYTGNNTVPASASPANAMILASDFISQPILNWRFEFNIAQLLSNYPASTSFVFYVKGRGNTADTLNGSFVLKTPASQMTLIGSAGSYLPSVSGDDLGDLVDFSSPISSGANGSYTEASLSTIIRLVYDVASKTISYTTGPDTTTGNITVTAFYGMTILSVLNGTGSGVPASLNGCDLLPSENSLVEPYTTLTAGTYQMVLDGTPEIPSHTFATMSVGGVNVGTQQLISGGGTFTFTLTTAVNRPEDVAFSIITG